MNSVLKTKTILTFIFSILIYGLLTFDFRLQTSDCGLVYAQNAKLKVPADVTTQTLILDPQASAPATANEGQIYYNDTDNQPYYYDGTDWKSFSGQDKTVASKIVAASNSIDKDTKADYVCDGTDDQVEIQAAIDSLGTIGGAVYLLEGTYNISGSINLDNTVPDDSGKAIIGTGAGTVLKVKPTVDGINASNVSRILISQLMIDKGLKFGTKDGIYFSLVSYSQINKVWIENVPNGINLVSSSNNILSENHLKHIVRTGILLYNSSNNNIVVANNLEDEDIGIGYSSNNNIISGNNIQGKGAGILAQNSLNNIFSGNNLQTNNTVGG